MSYQADLSDVELRLLRYLRDNSDAPRTAAEIAPHVGLSPNEAADRLNELEWVGYVEEHSDGNGADSAFTLTPDGLQAATGC